MAALHDYLEKNGLLECEVSLFFLKLKIKADRTEKEAAWILFVELATRIATQELPDDVGMENRALGSLYDFFIKARDILVERGRLAQDFSVMTVYTLNHVLRPFLAEWHKRSDKEGAFDNPDLCREFRQALRVIQKELRACAFCLADAAGIDPEITAKLLKQTGRLSGCIGVEMKGGHEDNEIIKTYFDLRIIPLVNPICSGSHYFSIEESAVTFI